MSAAKPTTAHVVVIDKDIYTQLLLKTQLVVYFTQWTL